MSEAPADLEPIFHGPIHGRLPLRRAGLIALTALAHALVLLALMTAHLLVVESVDPPKAVTATRLVFRAPDSLPGTREGGAGAAAGGRSGSTVTPDPAPPIKPPPPRPVVIPLPPPADESAESHAPRAPEGAAVWGIGGDDPSDSADGAGGGTGRSHGPGGVGDDGPGPGSDDRVYDDHHPDITPPVKIEGRSYPRYPDLARKAGVQGTVILLIVIDREGRVGEIEVLRSPDPRFGFEMAAIEAVKEWRYRPALLGGRPVAVQASVTFEFTISR